MPYRIDLLDPPADAFDRLVALGALDVEGFDGGIAAILPDDLEPERLSAALGIDCLGVSPAVGRDENSVWVISPGRVRVGRIDIAPAGMPAAAETVRLIDSPAFGTGRHPTTALCLEILDETVHAEARGTDAPARVLDVGTGSGVLALAALRLGIRQAIATDIDAGAVRAAAENARLNGLQDRLHLVTGGPEALRGSWPLVLANVLAAPLVEMAPTIVQRVAGKGLLVLSGIPIAVAPDVRGAYRRLGMVGVEERTRAGWTALLLRASWGY